MRGPAAGSGDGFASHLVERREIVTGPSGRVASIAGRLLASLEHRDFRTLWTANLSAGAAAWALIVARGWVVLDLSQSNLMVGAATFAAMIPRILVTPFAGLLADRMNRRTLLAVAHGANLAQVLVLAVLALTGTVAVWHLLVLALINGCARSIQMSAAQALLPNLIPRDKLLNAVALNAATMHGSRLLGPLLILPLMASANPGWAFALCGGLYTVTLVQVLRIRTASTGALQAGQGIVGNLLAGLFYIYRDPLLLSLILLVAAHCCLTMAFESLFPILSRSQFGAGGAGVSALMMGVGAGALISTLGVAGVQASLTKGRIFMILGLLSGIAPVGLALAPNMVWAWLATMGMGASQAGFMAINTTIVQSIIPDAIRGRIAGAQLWHTGGMMAFFNLMYGGLADVVPGGAATILAVTGTAFVGVITLSVMRAPLRRIYTRGTPAARQAAPA